MVAINLLDLFFNIDKFLSLIIQNYGIWVYFILFVIILLETGFILTPILPGGSLIFLAGTFAWTKLLNIYLVFTIFVAAAILGDSLNYFIGKYLGENVFAKSRFFKKENLEKTKKFYKKYGGKTIFLGRFVPIIRTFVPFVAGIGEMKYSKFLLYNISGAIAWVVLFLGAGYFFGGIPLIKNNLGLFVILIIFITIIPLIIQAIKNRKRRNR